MQTAPAIHTDTQKVDARTSKAQITRQKILGAACELFGARGYDGTSLRDVEQDSGVNRGLVAYHFGDKEALWKAVVDSYFSDYIAEMKAQRDVLGALDAETRARVSIRNFVLFSVRRPHLNKLMIQENLNPTWRQDWIIERYLKPIRGFEQKLADEQGEKSYSEDPVLRYALIGACTMPFTVAPEIKKMDGVDVFDETFVERLIETITEIYLSRVRESQ